jgi:hypothetical protein
MGNRRWRWAVLAAACGGAAGLAAVTWQLSWTTLSAVDGEEIPHRSSLLTSDH